MTVVIVTGSAGLIGSEAVRHFAALGLDVVGIDNDMRAQFFGPEASTAWNVQRLRDELGSRYTHCDEDIRDRADTDLALARAMGCRAVLVLTGVTSAADLPVNPEPDEVADDLAAAVDHFLSGR